MSVFEARVVALLVLVFGAFLAWLISRPADRSATRIILAGATLSVVVAAVILILWG